jgi:arginase
MRVGGWQAVARGSVYTPENKQFDAASAGRVLSERDSAMSAKTVRQPDQRYDAVSLIQVPYHAGDDRHRSSEGPARLIQAGAADLLRARGLAVTVERVDRGGPFRDTASSAAAVNRELARAVARAQANGALPLILSGSCNSSMGVLAGFDHSRCGAVWIDAHADFNTPESTASGFFPGMSLAVVTGHCYRTYWAQIGDNAPLAEEAVVLFGVRDLYPDVERERLERSAIEVVPWRDGEPQRDVGAALDRLAERVDEIYLHVDFDGFAPEVAPGIVDEPAPGGLTHADAARIIRGAMERFRVRAVTLATYTPDNDEDEKTLRLALNLIELVAEMTGARA